MRLPNKVAIITGAAIGIGRACAVVFAEEGAKVVAADINDADGEKTVAMIKSKGGDAIYVHTDVSVASETENLIKVTNGKFGKIDILLNVAAIPQKHMPIEDMDDAQWDKVYGVNVKGIFHTMKYTIPFMKKARSGSIINVGALAGIRPPMPNSSALCSSKGAVIILTKSVAMELVPYNVRVNCINPGGTETPKLKEIMEDVVAAGMEAPKTPGGLFGRLIKPEEIAYAAVYLASDEALMLSGINIDVNGGNV
jgi:3-oxoacyl-[acyl-carrier protein] reductase